MLFVFRDDALLAQEPHGDHDQTLSKRAFPNSQQTPLREHSSLLNIPNAGGVLQGERGTISATRGTHFSSECLCLPELRNALQ